LCVSFGEERTDVLRKMRRKQIAGVVVYRKRATGKEERALDSFGEGKK